MPVCPSSKGSTVSLSRTTASVSLVATFVNRLTMSRLTIWLKWLGALLVLSAKWAEFLRYDEDLLARELMVFTNGSMADMLNLGYWWWFQMEYHLYVFWKTIYCGGLLLCWISCLYFICYMKSLFLVKTWNNFFFVFIVGSFFTLQ